MNPHRSPPAESCQRVGISRPTAEPDHCHPFETWFATRAVQGGNSIDAETGAIRGLIVTANSYELPDEPPSPGPSRTLFCGGTVVTFELVGGKDDAFAVMNALQIVDISNNLGDVSR